MPRTCTICRHPDRVQIDRALVAGHESLRGLASNFGVSASAMQRHRIEHVPAVLTKAKSLDELITAESLADQVRNLRARTLGILVRAEASGDTKTELAALRELRALTELEARGADRDATVIHVSIVQQYVHRLIEVVREFVPAERVEAAIARIEFTVQQEQGPVTQLPGPPSERN